MDPVARRQAVALRQVAKTYDNGVAAVADVDLSIAAGEFLTVVGPSGCGKTTLLRLIAGLEKPTRGAVLLDGSDAIALSPARRNVALVFQSGALYPHLTVFENLAFSLRGTIGSRGVAKDEVCQRVSEAARSLQIEGLLRRLPGELSAGQRQRVALGRALVRRPAVYLFDEPLANLDPPLRRQMRSELRRLHESLGATMIYVTHDPLEARRLGQRLAVMNAGRLTQIDTPAGVVGAPSSPWVADFFTDEYSFADGHFFADQAKGIASACGAGDVEKPLPAGA